MPLSLGADACDDASSPGCSVTDARSIETGPLSVGTSKAASGSAAEADVLEFDVGDNSVRELLTGPHSENAALLSPSGRWLGQFWSGPGVAESVRD